MRYFYSTLLLLYLQCPFLYGQTGTTRLYTDESKASKHVYPRPLDGSGMLGQMYNNTDCGLNYVQASQKLGKRFHNSANSCNPVNGVSQPATLNISGIPSCSVIDKAYLWTSTSGDGVAITASLKNPLGVTTSFPMTIIGSGPDKCWGATGSYTYRADVTSAIAGNGAYRLSGLPTATYDVSPGNDVDGATLFIIYKDLNATYSATLVIDDGCFESGDTAKLSPPSYASHDVTGFTACDNSSSAQALMIVSDMRCPTDIFGDIYNTFLTFNGSSGWVAAENWWNSMVINTTVNAGQTTSSFVVDGSVSGDCWDFLMAGIYFQNTTCTVCTPFALAVTPSSTAATCASNNGTATGTPSNGTGPYTYSWNTGPVQTTQTATGLAAGTYTVTVTDNNGCTGTKSVTITGGSVTADAGSPVAICNGKSTILTATGGGTYSWSPGGATTSSITVSPSSLTTYTVTVTGGGGCTATATVAVTVNALPLAPTISHSANWDTLFVTPATYTSYQWYKNSMLMGGKTSDTIVIGNDTSKYNVVVSNVNNCVDSATAFQSRLLPIELLSFDAIYNGKVVDIYWSTSSEINNDFFTVERTKNGFDFSPVFKQKGAGTSSSVINYSGVDESPLFGISAYRLKQTDFDGKYAYSRLVAVNTKSTGKLEITALNKDPDQNIIHYLVFSSSGKPFNIEVTDRIGRVLMTTVSNENIGTLDFSSMAHGVYIFRIFDDNASSVKRFVY